MFFLLARFYARPMSYKALILAFQLNIFNEKGVICVEEEKFGLPVDVRGSKTSVLKLSIVGRNMLRAFGHRVATCWVLLAQI